MAWKIVLPRIPKCQKCLLVNCVKTVEKDLCKILFLVKSQSSSLQLHQKLTPSYVFFQ